MGKQKSSTSTKQKDSNSRVRCSCVYIKDTVAPKKSETWNLLNPSILSEQGKKIVSEDPNLSDKTMKKLLDLNDGVVGTINLYIDEDDAGERLSSVARALVSTCIKDNLFATWAEFTARIASIYRFPFLEVAIALKAYKSKHGAFVYFQDGTCYPIQWEPKMAHIDESDFVRETVLDEDWGDIAS